LGLASWECSRRSDCNHWQAAEKSLSCDGSRRPKPAYPGFLRSRVRQAILITVSLQVPCRPAMRVPRASGSTQSENSRRHQVWGDEGPGLFARLPRLPKLDTWEMRKKARDGAMVAANHAFRERPFRRHLPVVLLAPDGGATTLNRRSMRRRLWPIREMRETVFSRGNEALRSRA